MENEKKRNSIYSYQSADERKRPENRASKRVAKLRIYNPDGDSDDVLIEIKSGGDKVPRRLVKVTRGRYFNIIDRILENEELVREIIEEWRRQILHWLSGAEEPLPFNDPNPLLLQKLCEPEDEEEAALILANLRNLIENQIVALKASEADLKSISPIEREFI